jgi:hypothetical protein
VEAGDAMKAQMIYARKQSAARHLAHPPYCQTELHGTYDRTKEERHGKTKRYVDAWIQRTM